MRQILAGRHETKLFGPLLGTREDGESTKSSKRGLEDPVSGTVIKPRSRSNAETEVSELH